MPVPSNGLMFCAICGERLTYPLTCRPATEEGGKFVPPFCWTSLKLRTSDERASKQSSKLDEAMEDATINAKNPAIISIRRDHDALLKRMRSQSKHLEASDRHLNQMEKRVVKLENGSAAGNLVRRLEQLEGKVERLLAALSALRGVAL